MEENTVEKEGREQILSQQEEELLRKLGEVSFRDEYESVCRILEKTLQGINEEMTAHLGRDYISSIEWRVKSPKSCIEKMKHKGVELTLKDAVERLNDIAGVRVVCSFLDDMYALCNRLITDYGFEKMCQGYLQNR